MLSMTITMGRNDFDWFVYRKNGCLCFFFVIENGVIDKRDVIDY